MMAPPSHSHPLPRPPLLQVRYQTGYLVEVEVPPFLYCPQRLAEVTVHHERTVHQGRGVRLDRGLGQILKLGKA